VAKTPLHARIAAELRGRIHDRELTPGDLLPSESSLQEQFSVSRSVVRQALATLESEGLVRRARGRGTIVAPQVELHRDVEMSSGLSAQVQRMGSRTSTAVLRLEPTRPPVHLTALGPEVTVIERLRSVDDRPVAFIRTYVPSDVAASFTREELVDGSLHQLIRERTGRYVAGGERTIRAVAAAPPLDSALGVDPGAPLLLLEGLSRDQDGEVVESFSTWHRSDLIAFDVSLQPATERVIDDRGGLAGQVERATALAEQALEELHAIRGQL
jgi:GntR family transcriptional regulator